MKGDGIFEHKYWIISVSKLINKKVLTAFPALPTKEAQKSSEKIIHWSLHTPQDQVTGQKQLFLTAVSS